MTDKNRYAREHMRKLRAERKKQGITRREYIGTESRHKLLRKIEKLKQDHADAIEARVDDMGAGDE